MGCLALSVGLYVLHYFIFIEYNPHHIFISLLGDLAFLPLYFLVVFLGLHELMTRREKRDLLRKFNMIVGTFYSEIGKKLIGFLNQFEPDTEKITQTIFEGMTWSAKEISNIGKQISKLEYQMECQSSDLRELKYFLLSKRTFLLILLENPTLLELESFSELLWAVFHLIDEFDKIPEIDLEQLTKEEYDHLNEDIKETYVSLVLEWLDYMKRMKDENPYLFTLALKASPFKMTAEK